MSLENLILTIFLLGISERGSPMRGWVLSAFIKSRHFIKQSLLVLFWLPLCKPRVDKTS